MRVLVTGATGFIGYEVARQLAEACVRPRLAGGLMPAGFTPSKTRRAGEES